MTLVVNILAVIIALVSNSTYLVVTLLIVCTLLSIGVVTITNMFARDKEEIDNKKEM
jgi:hypothetical protein